MISGETKQLDDNLISWKLVSAEPSKLEIDLEFREPIEVSQGDLPDKLLIQIEMAQFKDEFGNNLPPGLLKETDLPT